MYLKTKAIITQYTCNEVLDVSLVPCVGSLVPYQNNPKPLQLHQRRSVANMTKVCCAKRFQFDSHLGDFRFGSSVCTYQITFFYFFQYILNFRG